MVEGKGYHLTAQYSLAEADMQSILEGLALSAGAAILELQAQGISARTKADLSPVTMADERAEEIILEGLAAHFPDIAVVAEEATAAGKTSNNPGTQFFLVDALDGTKEFVAGRPDFTVNIALIEHCVPVIGIVYAPAHGVLYSASKQSASKVIITGGKPAERTEIGTACTADKLQVLASRSHMSDDTQSYLDTMPDCEIVNIGSSLKFCMIAEGKAHLYPRFGRTMEWDTAAGDAILRAVGGITRTRDGKPLTYGKCAQADEAPFANSDFVASRSQT